MSEYTCDVFEAFTGARLGYSSSKTGQLSPAAYEAWRERAAIMEYDGNMPRDVAEREALADVRREFGI